MLTDHIPVHYSIHVCAGHGSQRIVVIQKYLPCKVSKSFCISDYICSSCIRDREITRLAVDRVE
jgi:hypothetical protein